MPQIKEYNQQYGVQGGFNTAQISPESAAQAGRNIQQIGAAVGNVGEVVQQREDMMQTSDASTKFAQLRTNYTIRIKKESEDGTINSDKILEDYQSEVDKINEGLTSLAAQKFAISASNELKNSVAVSSFAAQSELARVAVLENYQKKMANFSETLYYDPSQYGSIQKQYDEWLANLPMGAKQIEKLKYDGMKELSISRIKGMIGLTPTDKLSELSEAIKHGVFKDQYLDATSVEQLQSRINTEINARDAKLAHSIRLEEKDKKNADDAGYNDWITKIMLGKAVNVNEIATDKRLSGVTKRNIFTFMKSDPAMQVSKIEWEHKFADFANRARLKDGEKDKIYNLTDIGYLKEEEFPSQYRIKLGKIIQDSQTPEGKIKLDKEKGFLKSVQVLIAGDPAKIGFRDPNGMAKYNKFQDEYYVEKRKLQEQGIDPSELMNPSSKYYIMPRAEQMRAGVSEIVKSTTGLIQGKRPKNKDNKEMNDDEIMKAIDKGEL